MGSIYVAKCGYFLFVKVLKSAKMRKNKKKYVENGYVLGKNRG